MTSGDTQDSPVFRTCSTRYPRIEFAFGHCQCFPSTNDITAHALLPSHDLFIYINTPPSTYPSFPHLLEVSPSLKSVASKSHGPKASTTQLKVSLLYRSLGNFNECKWHKKLKISLNDSRFYAWERT